MKLASLRSGPDGRLLVVSRDLSRAVPASAALTLQAALDDWVRAEPTLQEQSAALERGAAPGAFPVDPQALDAVLPRGFQFLDASAFLAHNHILAAAWGYEKRTEAEPPLMYQGISHKYLAAYAPAPFRSTEDQIDLEGEVGVITDAVPMGVSPEAALNHVKLIIMINDWSLRAFGPSEMRGGFGFIHAKPPSALSAFAATPDELGPAWRDGRVDLSLRVLRNGEQFGAPSAGVMHFGFGDLIAHAARTRNLCPGTVIGSGTVSNFDASAVGSACIAERRALDVLADRSLTPFLSPGETVTLELLNEAGVSVLGRIEQKVMHSV